MGAGGAYSRGRNRQTDRARSNSEYRSGRPRCRTGSRGIAARRDRHAAPAARPVARRLAILRPAELLEPDPAHHLPQSHRPDRAGDRDSLPVAVPRRTDRGAHPEPSGPGRDHGRCDRLIGDRRAGHHRVRSRPAARTAGRRELRSVRGNAVGDRVLDQSGAGRAGAAPPRVADQYPRAHLRPRRRARARQPQSLRRAALRPAAAPSRQARHARALLHHHPHLGEPRHAAALSRVRARRAARATRRWSTPPRATSRAWCASTSAAK